MANLRGKEADWIQWIAALKTPYPLLMPGIFGGMFQAVPCGFVLFCTIYWLDTKNTFKYPHICIIRRGEMKSCFSALNYSVALKDLSIMHIFLFCLRRPFNRNICSSCTSQCYINHRSAKSQETPKYVGNRIEKKWASLSKKEICFHLQEKWKLGRFFFSSQILEEL